MTLEEHPGPVARVNQRYTEHAGIYQLRWW
jgi:hypothetical protein